MSVKRYSLTFSGALVVSQDGGMVDYDDYSALEQKLAESQREFRAADATIENLQMQVEKLAAENAQMLRLLTDISENHDEYVNQDEYLYAGFPMDYVSEINSYVSRDVEAENPFKATHAFLAEVRAQGVEMCSAEIQKQIWDEREGDGIVAAIDAMEIYAAQLRKGVQS